MYNTPDTCQPRYNYAYTTIKEEKEMPPIFKALAPITAQILFVGRCLGVVFAMIAWITTTDITEVDTAITIDFLAAAVTLVAGVVVMILRQKME